MIEILTERWPELFGTKSQPLALGITTRIAAELGFTDREVSKVIAKHCSKPRYITAISEGVQRRDIDGTLTDVTEAHQARAKQTLIDMAAAQERRVSGKAARRAANNKPQVIPDLSPKPVVIVKKRRVLEIPR